MYKMQMTVIKWYNNNVALQTNRNESKLGDYNMRKDLNSLRHNIGGCVLCIYRIIVAIVMKNTTSSAYILSTNEEFMYWIDRMNGIHC